MTEEKLKEATFLKTKIVNTKDEIKRWEKGNGYDNSNIDISLNSSGVGTVTLSHIMLFSDLQKIALEKLNKDLDKYTKEFEDL